MKKLFLVLTFIVLSFCTYIKVNALVEPTSEFYVNDYANILSKETENYIIDKSSKLASSSGIQIVVVTVNNLEGQDIETYATDLFRKFGIGDAKENNGLLILISLQERKIRIEVGYGLEGVITDGLSGRYLDKYFIPYLKEDKWDEGIKNGYSAFYEKLDDYYVQGNHDTDYENNNSNYSTYSDLYGYSILYSLFASSSYIYFLTLNHRKIAKIKKNKKTKRQREKLKKERIKLLIASIIFLIVTGAEVILLRYIYTNFPEYYNETLGDSFMYFIASLIFIIMFILADLSSASGSGYSGGGSSSGGYSGGGSSGGGYSGGGGSSGGGGASRIF